MQWLKTKLEMFIAPWKKQQEREQLMAGIILEQAQNGSVLNRLEKEIAELVLVLVDQGLTTEEVKETIAFVLLEISKEEKR